MRKRNPTYTEELAHVGTWLVLQRVATLLQRLLLKLRAHGNIKMSAWCGRGQDRACLSIAPAPSTPATLPSTATQTPARPHHRRWQP